MGQHEGGIHLDGVRCAAGSKESQSAQRVCSEVVCGLFCSVSAEWLCARAQPTSGSRFQLAITMEYRTCGVGALRAWAVVGPKCLLARRSMVPHATSEMSHALSSHGLATIRGTLERSQSTRHIAHIGSIRSDVWCASKLEMREEGLEESGRSHGEGG